MKKRLRNPISIIAILTTNHPARIGKIDRIGVRIRPLVVAHGLIRIPRPHIPTQEGAGPRSVVLRPQVEYVLHIIVLILTRVAGASRLTEALCRF